jgi:hypothetical protein
LGAFDRGILKGKFIVRNHEKIASGPTKSSFRQPDEHFMVVSNHGDFLPIGLPQFCDVGSETVQGESYVTDHACPDIAQVGPVCSHRTALADMSPSGS